MTKDEALKQAIWILTTIEENKRNYETRWIVETINACKEALEQPACPECGGDGAGGEHEEDCSRLQPAQEPVNEQKTWRHDCKVMGYGWTTWENGCRHCGQWAPEWFNKHMG